MRVLYIPNERPTRTQTGYRRALSNLNESGLIDDLAIFSLQLRILNGGDIETEISHLLRLTKEFRPDTILIQRPQLTHLKNRHLEKLRESSSFSLIYHEADPYALPLHPLPASSRAVARHADVVFTVGTGAFFSNFRRVGVKDVRFMPSGYANDYTIEIDETNFATKTHDVVVMANKQTPRLRGLPNWRERIKFVELLQDRFGDRLAIYGNNWEGPGAMGPSDYYKQDETVHSGWITANWDHFAEEPHYFSNRLPTALAAGSVHATTRHSGFDEIFPRETERFLLLGDSPNHLVDLIEKKLSESPKSELIASSLDARIFADKHFRQDRQIVKMLNFRGLEVDPSRADEIWNVSGVINTQI